MICSVCKQTVDPREAYQRVVGWERPRRGAKDKSGSSLVLREKLEVFCCSVCVANLRYGGQEVLL